MTNSEKREKVVDELIRRKKVIENYMDMVFKPSEFHTAKFGYCVDMIEFIRQTLCNIGMNDGYDYSDSESYLKSVEENYKKSPFLMSYRNVFGSSFANINAYIGKVIYNINSNHYPEEYYEIINVRDW